MSPGEFTPGPLDWQRFGKEWCLTGQYGMRPIVLSVSGRGSLMLRNAKRDLLVPFSPDHPDARLIAAAPDLYTALRHLAEACEVLQVPGISTYEARDALEKAVRP